MPHCLSAKPIITAIAIALSASFAASLPHGKRESSRQELPGKQESSLDFETYRARVEPVFLKEREGGVRCYDCHSTMVTRLRLEPLPSGGSSWTEEQSRKNFTFVQQLVTPGVPLKSRLLLHPLAPTAGGDPVHTGGKFWQSQNDPEWQAIAAWVCAAALSPPSEAAKTSTAAKNDALDFQTFRSTIQPIFLKERPGHARCYGCHNVSNRVFQLATLSPGRTDWNDEQSRKNFESVSQLVIPGKPESSRFLLHPLSPEAGGDAFHSGGRQFASSADPDWIAIMEWVRSGKGQAFAKPAPESAARIYVTNSAGNTVDVIDPAVDQVVQVIRGIELPHGVGFSPDGSRVYVSNESDNTLDVIDRESARIVQKVSLSGHPNNIAVARDGRHIFVGIRMDQGSVDVIEAASLQRVKNIPVHGSVHNIFVTPDGRYAVSGSIESKTATVIDLHSLEIAWEVKFASGVRPMAFETKPDGSTRRIFIQLSGVNGFAVVDFEKRAEIRKVMLPENPGGFGGTEGRLGTPSHGIGVAPDGKSLWVNSTVANAIFKYSLPDLRLVGYCALPEVHPLHGPATGSVPEWITFTPDGGQVYVSNSGARSVSVINTSTLKSVAVIPVGEVPKRINTLVLH